MNHKQKIITSISLFAVSLGMIYFGIFFASADDTIASRTKGKILLQVEDNGEAWYVNPSNLKRYYMGRPQDAFDLMKNLSTGITNTDLAKIPVGLIGDNNTDSDSDGLNDDLEKALGTNPAGKDSDNDGYGDKVEIISEHNPLATGLAKIDANFTKVNSGKIFLQVEAGGAAWYVNPADNKRYYLNRPTDAFSIMRSLGLGIKSSELAMIEEYYDPQTTQMAQVQSNTTEKKEYTNSNYKYSIEYPSTWSVKSFSSAPTMIQVTDARLDYVSEHKGVVVINYFKLDKEISDINIYRVASKSPSKTLTDAEKTINNREAYENSYEHQKTYEKTTTIKINDKEFFMITLATTNDQREYYEKIYDEIVSGANFN